MDYSLPHAPANRAFDVFRSLFETEEDLAAWLWKHKQKIFPDCIYHDGTDGVEKQYVDIIQTEDPKTGLVAVFDEMPSRVEVSGIGTNREQADIFWIDGPSGKTTELRPPDERHYDVTLADYQKWAKANGIRSRMPIMKK